LKTKLHGLVIVDIPHLALPIPCSVRLFDAALQSDFLQAGAKSDQNRLRFGRRPTGFLDDNFDGRESFALLAVIPVANTDEPVAVLVEELFGSFLSWVQFSCASNFTPLPA